VSRLAAPLVPAPGPARVLVAATFLGSVGTGVQLAACVLFFTRVAGLPAGQVSLALTGAAVAGLLAGVPLGAVADRRGARSVLLAVVPAQAVAVLCWPLVSSAGLLVLVLGVGTALETGASTARGALVGGLFAGERRVAERARLRAVTNVGVGAGSVLTGAALLADRRAAFIALFGVAAVLLAAATVVLRRLPGGPAAPPSTAPASSAPAGPAGPPADPAAPIPAGLAVPPPAGPAAPPTGPAAPPAGPAAPPTGPAAAAPGRSSVLADRRYLAVLALQVVLFLDYGMLEVAIPLWTAEHTAAPVALVAVLFVVNTAVIAVGQVRASRGTGDIAGAGRRARSAGLMLALACVLVAAAGGRDMGLAVLLLLAGGLAHVAGEMAQAAASWGLAYGLAPEPAQGRYQGALSGAVSLAGMLAPVLLVQLVVGPGVPGWLGLAVAFAAAGWLTGPVGRWAARDRPPAAVPGARL
jgi:MFS family permease